MSLTDTILFINGKQIKPSELPIIPAGELGLNVFETMKSHKSRILYLKEHMDRLFESAKTAGIKIPKTRKQIEKKLSEIAKKNSSHSIRIAVTEKYIFTIAAPHNYSKKIYDEGIDLKTSTVRRNHSNSVPPEAKSSELMNALLAFLDFGPEQPFGQIYLGIDGYIREAGIWNFFMIKDGVLKTPPTAGILNGVIRRFVIKYALESGIPAEETFFTRHDVFNADEAFLTNSIGEIVPAKSLDGRRIGPDVPGPVTKKLIRRIHQDES